MKILIISKTLTFHRNGGFETHVTELATRLAERGHKVDVICRPLTRKVRANFSVYGTKYAGINVDAVDNVTSIPFFVRKIRNIAKNSYDIAHGHGTSALAYPLSGTKSPFVYTLHGVGEKNLAGYNRFLVPLLKLPFDLQKFSLMSADRVICQSHSMMTEGPDYYKFDKKKCIMIPSSLDTKKFRCRRTDGRKLVGFVGFLHERKGLDSLITAMKNVISNVPDAKLVVIGNGDAERFRTLAKKLKTEKNVIFMNNVSDEEMVKLYNTFDVFCLPSRYESFGLAAYEAVAAGTPVVLSRAADFEDLASGTGFTVDAGDVQEIAEKVTLLLKDEKLRKKLSRNCHKKITPFDWSVSIRKIEKLYESLL